MTFCSWLRGKTQPVRVDPPPRSSWIQVIRRTDKCTDDDVRAWCDAVEFQAREQLAPAWFGYYGGCDLEPIRGDQMPANDAWWVVISDTPDTTSALGYHDMTPQGKPLSKVFTQPTLGANEKISGVVSHEVCEMLVDPYINQWAFDLQRYCYAMESSDAVQGNDYDVNGITVADFVTARFFDPLASETHKQGDFDFMGVVKYPFQTMPQGYQLRLGNDARVEQVYGRGAITPVPPASRGLPGSRRERRRRGHRNWTHSLPA